MSKRKKSYKIKYKGVRYIAKALVKYQTKKYPNYKIALPDARRYFSELKLGGKKVRLSNLWELSRTRKATVQKSAIPIIDRNLLELSFFFELVDYPTWIARCTNKIWFTSKIIPEYSNDIQGGTIVSYEEYFAPFVNYINGMKALTSPEDNRYETDWLVTCTTPIFNTISKRWESKIISVDSDGNDFDYGFNPNIPNLLATTSKLSGTVKQLTPPTTEPLTPPQLPQIQNAERVKEIRGLISDLRQDVKDGLISKEDYSKIVKELTSKLDKGGYV